MVSLPRVDGGARLMYSFDSLHREVQHDCGTCCTACVCCSRLGVPTPQLRWNLKLLLDLNSPQASLRSGGEALLRSCSKCRFRLRARCFSILPGNVRA